MWSSEARAHSYAGLANDFVARNTYVRSEQGLSDYYMISVNDIFDYHHITTIVNFANHTKRLNLEPEDLDASGVT